MSQRQRKLLVVSYYWPPSGGSGVQRWLKLTGYLAELGWQIHVLTVEPDSANFSARPAGGASGERLLRRIPGAYVPAA